MKKSTNTTNHNTFSQEKHTIFLALTKPFFRVRNEFTAVFSGITFLFQEKLPIIYANIRV